MLVDLNSNGRFNKHNQTWLHNPFHLRVSTSVEESAGALLEGCDSKEGVVFVWRGLTSPLDARLGQSH